MAFLHTARLNLHPCLGCPMDVCRSRGCVQTDDGGLLRERVLACDMLVLVTPVYFYNMSAQPKIALDRSHCFYPELQTRHIRSALLATACRTDDEVMSYLANLYQGLASYLQFCDCGMVLARGCGYASLDKAAPAREQARALGLTAGAQRAEMQAHQ